MIDKLAAYITWSILGWFRDTGPALAVLIIVVSLGIALIIGCFFWIRWSDKKIEEQHWLNSQNHNVHRWTSW